MTFCTEPNWLDKTVPRTALGERVIVRVTVPEVEPPLQLRRVWAAADFILEGKFASAAHVLREFRAANPWINGEYDAYYEA